MKFINWLVASCLCLFISLVHADPVRVAAATDLRYVLPVLAQKFEQKSGHKIDITFAASGSLATQIRHGAPFQLLFSADPKYIQLLINAGLTKGVPVDYARGYLALYAAKHSSIKLDADLSGIRQALSQGRIHKFAIANPRHAPYGQAAQALLQQKNLWQPLQPFLLLAENASQTTQFAMSSQVDAAIIPYTHAIQPAIAKKGRAIRLGKTLQQQAILLDSATPAAQAFLNFINQASARQVFTDYGFAVTAKVEQ